MPRSHGSEIDTLIQLLAKLPGLGPRSARRSTLQLLKKRDSVMVPLARALEDVAAKIVICASCGNIDTSDPCHVCVDGRRDRSTVCVVEDVADLWALDRSETIAASTMCLAAPSLPLMASGRMSSTSRRCLNARSRAR